MKLSLRGRNRRLLLRSYLFLAAGLLAVATLLDLGFGYLHSSLGHDEDRLVETSLRLIEMQLAAVPAEERDAIAAQTSQDLELDIQLLRRDDIAREQGSGTAVETLIDADGNPTYLYAAPLLDRLIYLGPVDSGSDSLILRLLPPLFYLSIFVVTALWLSPLLKDLNLITSAAQRFAADYRKPLTTANETTQLTGLASNLDEMSSRLSGLIQSQKELIAALSHEMRTPLARIRFALALMGNGADESLKTRLDEVNVDVQEIDKLIGTMLEYARLDHPELRMNWQQVPIDAWLAEIRDKLHHPGRQLEIVTDEVLEPLRMDPRLMGLALSNLLSNAGRYAERAIRCHISSTKDGQRIEVHDDGQGIPEAERESVFKAFTRLDDSRNRDTGGYGLGLAIVARIVALHGGSVSVGDSSELGGARFTLEWGKTAASASPA
ncbi:MAG: ATP-binding protein [Pseudomonadota bacterium]